ncbi:hypothetical protein ABKA04_001224 [Annulohypoxylon sp. FPYF3050]
MANISHASVRKAKHDTYEKQLLKLEGEYANSLTCENPTEWKFFVATDTKSTVEFEVDTRPKIFDGTEQETADVKRNIWVKIAAIASDGPRDPLQPWFIKSPRVEVLDAGTILKHGETYEVAGNDAMTRPHVSVIDPAIKFLDHRVYRVTMDYAAADEMAKEKGIAESMKESYYRCWIIPLPGRTDDGGNVSAVTIVLRLDQEATNLPRRGDTFKVQLSGLQRKATYIAHRRKDEPLPHKTLGFIKDPDNMPANTLTKMEMELATIFCEAKRGDQDDEVELFVQEYKDTSLDLKSPTKNVKRTCFIAKVR